jgi:hypothetical protein
LVGRNTYFVGRQDALRSLEANLSLFGRQWFIREFGAMREKIDYRGHVMETTISGLSIPWPKEIRSHLICPVLSSIK